MTQPQLPRARLYTRVSTYRQLKDGTSIPAQITQGVAYAAYRQLDLGPLRKQTFAGDLTIEAPERTYIDAASAFKKPMLERPDGSRLFRDLQKGDHLIVSKLDRGFRNTIDCINTVNTLREMGVTFHLLDIQLDTSTAFGEFGLTVMAAVAQLESRRRGERVSEAYRAKVALEGKRRKTSADPGFCWVGKGATKRLAEMPEEWPLMWAVWTLHTDGHSIEDILVAIWQSSIRVPEPATRGNVFLLNNDRQYSFKRVHNIVKLMGSMRGMIGGREEVGPVLDLLRSKIRNRKGGAA